MSGECDLCGNHCLECECTAMEAAAYYAINELSGVLEDLRGQFDPGDGGVCVRTLVRVIDHLSCTLWGENPEWTEADFVKAFAPEGEVAEALRKGCCSAKTEG